MSHIRLIQGECIEVMESLIEEGIRANLVLTDLPYGTTKCKWDNIISFEEMWDCIHRITFDDSAVILFGNEPFSSRLRLSNLDEYKYDIVWDKVVRTGFLNAKRQPLRQFENIMIFYQKQCTYNPVMWLGEEKNHPHLTKKKNTNVYGEHHEVPTRLTREKYPTNIVEFNARSGECNNLNRVHPTQKPVELLEYLITTYSDKKDLVLDFTMGSGSCGVACQRLGRDFIGIELDEEYFMVAKKRLDSVQQKLDF